MGLFSFLKKKFTVKPETDLKAESETAAPARPRRKKRRREKKLGDVIHTYNKISVAVIRLKNDIKVGDKLHIKGRYTDFVMTLNSIQIDHRQVEAGAKGQEIAIKVSDWVRGNDKVYLAAEKGAKK